MADIKNGHHVKQAEYYFDNNKKINATRGLAVAILMNLKKDAKIIRCFEELNQSFSHLNTFVSLNYDVLLSVERYDTPTKITFKFNTANPQSAPNMSIRSFHDRHIVLEAHSSRSKRDLCEALNKELEKQSIGIEAENLFLYDFLIPLKERFGDELIFVHYAGKSKDYKKGVDFTVGFKPRGQHLLFEIELNLKSSEKYLEKHKTKYPKISTFIFKPFFLEDKERLKRLFFSFLNQVVSEGVAHR